MLRITLHACGALPPFRVFCSSIRTPDSVQRSWSEDVTTNYDGAAWLRHCAEFQGEELEVCLWQEKPTLRDEGKRDYQQVFVTRVKLCVTVNQIVYLKSVQDASEAVVLLGAIAALNSRT
jgi:hypothetical protein